MVLIVALVLLGIEWQPVWVAAAGGAGLGLTGLFGWLVSRRTTSGSADRSDSGTLFEAMNQFRKDQELVIKRQDETIRRQDNQLREQAEQLISLRSHVAVLEDKVRRLEGRET